jgi:hypothetical protein
MERARLVKDNDDDDDKKKETKTMAKSFFLWQKPFYCV